MSVHLVREWRDHNYMIDIVLEDIVLIVVILLRVMHIDDQRVISLRVMHIDDQRRNVM